MSEEQKFSEDNDNQDEASAIEELRFLKQKLVDMDEFITRRFSELSMEINATSQQLDMAEEGLGHSFGEVLETLSAISYHGTGQTAANTGVELDAVIETTEKAANTILDAAEKIGTLIDKEQVDWNNGEARDQALNDVNMYLQDILMACSFQDLTGQRIRKALDSIKGIEDELSTAFEQMGVKYDVAEKFEELENVSQATQDDIDALFSD